MAEIERNVITVVSKDTDLEMHVSTLHTDRGKFIDVREFVPSLAQYGRGVTYPERFNEDVLNGLTEARNG